MNGFELLSFDSLRPAFTALLLSGAMVLLLPLLPRRANWARGLLVALTLVVTARYLWWRLTVTVLPAEVAPLHAAWIWFCFLIELAAFSEVAVFLLALARSTDRSAEADAHTARLRALPPASLPSVDVLIPTFNEGREILEKTIVGALGLDYPRATVWVLDDGRRDWLREFCAGKGARYLRRGQNAHAKAGNLNHALRQCRGELVAIFDADFVPRRDFLWRTVGFFADPRIGIVQTPQHFFNRDPIQLNLGLSKQWPDEQRLFFDVIQPGRDGWDAAMSCGSCSVVRRAALDEIGGFPVESITEDLLTSLALLRRGYVTRFLNERLSLGLAPESIEAYFIQRERWCHGGIQTLYLRNGPLRGAGLSAAQRVFFFPLYWIVQFPVRLVAMLIPAIYLWTELTPLFFTGFPDIVAYQLPVFVVYFGALYWLAPQRYMPMINAVMSVFTTLRLLPVALNALVRPGGKPFRVTPKGTANGGYRVDWLTLGIATTIAAVTAGGLVINIVPGWEILRDDQFFPVTAFWGTINLVILFFVGLICFEAPRWRSEERFALGEPAMLAVGSERQPCKVIDASLTGALLDWPKGQTPPADAALGALELNGVGAVPVQVVRVRGWGTRVALKLAADAPELRDRLIRRLFTTGLSNAVEEVTTAGVAAGLWQRAFGR